jgi:hypothetical protein
MPGIVMALSLGLVGTLVVIVLGYVLWFVVTSVVCAVVAVEEESSALHHGDRPHRRIGGIALHL